MQISFNQSYKSPATYFQTVLASVYSVFFYVIISMETVGTVNVVTVVFFSCILCIIININPFDIMRVEFTQAHFPETKTD